MRAIITGCFLLIWVPLFSQDTLSLSECHRLARENAPRLDDSRAIEQMGALKVRQASVNWYPGLELSGRATYQSDVIEIALSDPMIPVEFPRMPKDQYGINLDLSQTIYDGGMVSSRKNLEEASTRAGLQQVEVDLYRLKGQVNQLYFTILLLQEQRKNLEVHLENLLTRRKVVETAVESGTVLEGDLKLVDVEILRIKKSLAGLDAARRAGLDALLILCGKGDSQAVHLKDPGMKAPAGQENKRPEWLLFELRDASLEAGRELAGRKRMPLVYAFGQAGYGKPGYNMLSEEWDFYYRVGAGVRWQIWDWKESSREQQIIRRQQEMLRNRERTFGLEIESRRAREEARMEQIRESIRLEKELLELQEGITEQSATRLAHGTMTVAEYLTELSKENLSRIRLGTHRIELQQSIANYLLIQGNL